MKYVRLEKVCTMNRYSNQVFKKSLRDFLRDFFYDNINKGKTKGKLYVPIEAINNDDYVSESLYTMMDPIECKKLIAGMEKSKYFLCLSN